MGDQGSIVPDAIEPVVAWRAWVIAERPEGLRLHSVIRHTCVWAPRTTLEATCGFFGKHGDSVPDEGCACGVYGISDPRMVRPYLTQRFQEPIRKGDLWRAFGRVKMWGRTITGERGCRAQYAYPHSLALPARAMGFDSLCAADREEIAAFLRESYGVPVVVEAQPLVRRLLGR